MSHDAEELLCDKLKNKSFSIQVSHSHSGGSTEWPVVPASGNYDDGKFGGMKIGRGNRSTRRKPAPAPLCPPQIPLDQTQVWTRAAAVRSQRLTAWAMARPFSIQVNESTVFTNKSYVIAFVRFVKDCEIEENFFCCKELSETSI
jgi:hypothetical protein